MNKIFYRFFLLCSALLVNKVTFAQEMADVMRSNGKIYVVVAVCLTILVGLFIYVMLLDRRIRKMERENKM
jgi:uncharacterized membrane protein